MERNNCADFHVIPKELRAFNRMEKQAVTLVVMVCFFIAVLPKNILTNRCDLCIISTKHIFFDGLRFDIPDIFRETIRFRRHSAASSILFF